MSEKGPEHVWPEKWRIMEESGDNNMEMVLMGKGKKGREGELDTDTERELDRERGLQRENKAER